MLHSKNDETVRVLSFPSKLYNLLEDAEDQGFSDIIAWQKGGQSFKIHQIEEFANNVMTSYFSQTKFKSFQRQLNIYGWKKVQVGPNKGGYYHRDFIRGCPELCGNIVRRRCKDVNVPLGMKHSSFEAMTTPINDVHFFDMDMPRSLVNMAISPEQIRLEESEVTALYDFFYPKDPSERILIQNILNENPQTKLDTHCVSTKWDDDKAIDLSIFPSLESVDLDEFVCLLECQEEGKNILHDMCQDENDDVIQEPFDNCFPYKLHLMLENAERDNYSHIVSWVKGGTAFKVHDSKGFVAQVMPMYFDQSKYESFRRQLNLYEFTREARGSDRGVISHPQFLQGARWLCEEIKRARFLGRH